MRAHLHHLHSPDVANLETYAPQDPAHFTLFVQAMIGPEGSDDYESFDFTACSPAWLQRDLDGTEMRFGRGLILMRRYSYADLWRTLDDLCRTTVGDSWKSVGEKLNRYGRWEYEDYVPFQT